MANYKQELLKKINEAVIKTDESEMLRKALKIIDDFIDHYKTDMRKSETAHGAYLALNTVRKLISRIKPGSWER